VAAVVALAWFSVLAWAVVSVIVVWEVPAPALVELPEEPHAARIKAAAPAPITDTAGLLMPPRTCRRHRGARRSVGPRTRRSI
jgi:hypothetical protein